MYYNMKLLILQQHNYEVQPTGGNYMTMKEYLSQSFTLHQLLKAKESRIQDLRDMQERVGQISIGVKVKSSPKQDTMGDVVATLLDLIAEYHKDCLRILNIGQEIEAVIKTCQREDYRLILFERYINLKQWEDIAADNGYSEKHVYKLHSAALKMVKWIPSDTPNRGKVSA